MGHNKIVILVTTGLLLLSGVFFYTIHEDVQDYRAGVSPDVSVQQTWNLPEELKEISGIAFLEPGQMACVQDEKGVIFIYDLETSSVTKKIEFAGKGDYEGITLNGNTAYVLKSDGTIFKVTDLMGEAVTETFKTSFGTENDMESLFFDPEENKLLIMPKEEDLNNKNFKRIYKLDPHTLQMEEQPYVKVNLKEEIFRELRKNDKNRSFYPSDIIRHPGTGKIFILEAKKPHLLILDQKGQPEILHRLDPNLFPQPEGLAFDNSGNLYISNEGNPGSIHLVTLKKH